MSNNRKLPFNELASDANAHMNSLLRFVRFTLTRIKKSRTASQEPVPLLRAYAVMAHDFYSAYAASVACDAAGTDNDIRRILHKGVMKLTGEWHQINSIVAMDYLSGSFLEDISPIVTVARQEIGVLLQHLVILPHPGQRFALTQFNYAPHFSVLCIPVFNLDTPWEQTVIWHEIAGRKVSNLKKQARQVGQDDPFVTVLKKSVVDRDSATTAGGAIKPASLIAGGEKLEAVPVKYGWSAKWIQELFEDGCTVLSFGDKFLTPFARILGRYNEIGDVGHPPVAMRLWFARYLLNRAEPIPTDLQQDYPDLAIVAQNTAELLQIQGILPTHPQAQDNPVKREILSAIENRPDLTTPDLAPDVVHWINGQRSKTEKQTLEAISQLLHHNQDEPLHEFLISSRCALSENDFLVNGQVTYPGTGHLVKGLFAYLEEI
ncbi:MAG: hypothetical protein KA314_06940 [Chloroflexi bacterium]|nr:hypothetical protein [Chloroflexota bacterium]MBP8055561.1 hypothetical protein [Chloroflexota bacterium]